jgi:hypothetical protein
LVKFGIIPDHKIRITGFPRFDLWLTPKPPLYERPVVLLSYLKGYGAPNHFDEMLRIFASAAERYPAVPFIVKAKHEGEYPGLKATVRALSDKVQVVLSSDMPRILQGARAIIGYNSLSLLEGLMTTSPIFVPQWGEAKRPAKSQTPSPEDPRVKDHISFPGSEAEFLDGLDKAIAGRFPVSDLAERRAAFSKYVLFTPQEPATFRVRKFVEEFAGS